MVQSEEILSPLKGRKVQSCKLLSEQLSDWKWDLFFLKAFIFLCTVSKSSIFCSFITSMQLDLWIYHLLVALKYLKIDWIVWNDFYIYGRLNCQRVMISMMKKMTMTMMISQMMKIWSMLTIGDRPNGKKWDADQSQQEITNLLYIVGGKEEPFQMKKNRLKRFWTGQWWRL